MSTDPTILRKADYIELAGERWYLDENDGFNVRLVTIDGEQKHMPTEHYLREWLAQNP